VEAVEVVVVDAEDAARARLAVVAVVPLPLSLGMQRLHPLLLRLVLELLAHLKPIRSTTKVQHSKHSPRKTWRHS
jgi:hypothetical protein